MQITVVGGSGVLGRVLLPLLRKNGHMVRVLARSSRDLPPDEAEFVAFDLLADEAEQRLRRLLPGTDVLIHAATAIPRDFSAPGAFVNLAKLRIKGTKRLLSAALETGVARYVQQSITLAYPDGGEAWLDERTPFDTNPDREVICGPVAAMEALVRATPTGELSWSILRGGTFIGPGTMQDGTAAALRAGTLRIPGDGQAFASYVHVADMAGAVARAVESAPPGSTFNISADPVRQGDYLDRLADAIGARRPLRDASVRAEPSHRCSNRAAKEALGWYPGSSLYPMN